MFCTKCGNQVPDGVKFCTSCGNPMPAMQGQQNTGYQQNAGYQQNMQRPAGQSAPQFNGYAQPPKKGGKGPIIAIIVVAVLAIIGVIIFFVLRGMNNVGTNGSSAAQGSSAAPAPSGQGTPAGSSAAATNDGEKILQEYFRNNLAASFPEADKDYAMDYGGEYGEFRKAEVESGTVSATYADIDNDGILEMLVVFWNLDKYTGRGDTSVGVFKADGNLVKRIDNNEIRSVSYGGTNYTAQAAFEQKNGGIYIYLTTIFDCTTHEGGYLEPTARVYEVKEGAVRLLCDTSTAISSNTYSTEAFIKSVSLAKDYMPEVVSKWNRAVDSNTMARIYEERATIPLYVDLSKTDPNIRMLAVNHFMRTREGTDFAYSAGYYYGYWETYTGREIRGEYQDLVHEVLTAPTGTKPVENKDYIFAHSSMRLLTVSEVESLNLQELRIARNEIYARHGRRFKDKDLQAYFNSKSWYRGTIDADKFNDNSLTEIEKKNRDLIQEYEKKLGG